MGKKIHPFLLRTNYYPNYKVFNKVPFNLKQNKFKNNKLILSIYSFFKTLETKFIILDIKIIQLNFNKIIIYIFLPNNNSILSNEFKNINNKKKENLINEINKILIKLNLNFKKNYLFKIDIISSNKYFNYQNYLFYWIKYLTKKIFSFKIIFNEILKELNYLFKNNNFLFYGVKIKVSGRINGSELAKQEIFKKGILPLHTIINHIEYNNYFIKTKFGNLGVKIWLFIS
uniref:30S ribosomal protein S3 n=1 Tax=Nephromyces sp. ex Molgula occidentalis TaxID=2544991 RepID=A0A5C1H7K7_9APIC|nr:30S ribosomal protein S3 [Nephromyces sp. ex Molgula occidentalis]